MCLEGLKCRVVFGTHLHCYTGRRILLERAIAETGDVASGS